MIEILNAAATGVLHLLIATVLVVPFAWWSARRRGAPFLTAQSAPTLLLIAGLYVAAMVINRLPRIGFFEELMWNWQNKLLLFVVLILIVSLASGISWRDVGVQRPKRGWWIPVVSMIVLAIGLQTLVGPLAELPGDTEALLFQAIVPGLDEELFFRGVLLLLLDRALRSGSPGEGGKKRRIRWSAVASCMLFGFVHGLGFEGEFDLLFDPVNVIATGLMGWLLIWIRIRWDSLLPSVLAHNAWNSSIVVANMLAA